MSLFKIIQSVMHKRLSVNLSRDFGIRSNQLFKEHAMMQRRENKII